jgi:5'(3')-deoxyribonucleotidase
MKAMRIGIDIDEVLAPFLPTMTRWRSPQRPLPAKYKYLYRDIYDISEKESVKLVRDFYESEEFVRMPPIKYAVDAMTELKKGNKLFIVTGRQEVVRDKTQMWIQENFPGIFEDVIMTNSYTSIEIPKADVCKLLSIGLMIDDNFDVCRDCLDKNVAAVNFIGDPMYPWCEESIISVRSWKTVRDTLIESRETF